MSYDTTEIRTFDGNLVRTFYACRHDERVIPVETFIDGQVTTVAQLCLDCDTQLEVVEPAWRDA